MSPGYVESIEFWLFNFLMPSMKLVLFIFFAFGMAQPGLQPVTSCTSNSWSYSELLRWAVVLESYGHIIHVVFLRGLKIRVYQ